MDVFDYTDIGPSKSVNEDTIKVDADRGIYIVADGMSKRNGKVTSNIAVEATYEFLKNTQDKLFPKEKINRAILRDAFAAAQSQICQDIQTGQGIDRVGTTIDILVIQDNTALLGHVGDSRVYRASAGIVKQLTKDHVETDVLGRMINFIGNPNYFVDFKRLFLKDNDILMMCTDGIHKYASENAIKKAMLRSNARAEDIGQAIIDDAQPPNSEIQLATDNMSIIVYRHSFVRKTKSKKIPHLNQHH